MKEKSFKIGDIVYMTSLASSKHNRIIFIGKVVSFPNSEVGVGIKRLNNNKTDNSGDVYFVTRNKLKKYEF